jgi:hypothetical protein
MSSKKTVFLYNFSELYELIGADDWGLTCEILKKLVKSVCYKPKAGLSQKLLLNSTKRQAAKGDPYGQSGAKRRRTTGTL